MVAFESLADVLSIVITASAAVGGAIWAIYKLRKRRAHWPKANVSQEVQAVRLTDDEICIHTCARIQNIGDVMISICSAKNIAYQIRPLPASIQAGLKGQEVKFYDELNKEINWPELDIKEVTWKPHDFEVEPGEADTVHFDLIIPSDIEVIQIYTYFQNVKKRGRDRGWPTERFYDVPKLLSGGARECRERE
jgi:hypothetical protein